MTTAVQQAQAVDLTAFRQEEVTTDNFNDLVDIIDAAVHEKVFTVDLVHLWNHVKNGFKRIGSPESCSEAYHKLLHDIKPQIQNSPLYPNRKSGVSVKKPEEEDLALSQVADTVFTHKKGRKAESEQQKLYGFKEINHPFLWFADVTEAVFLAYEGVQGAMGVESLGIPALDVAALGFSVLGGLFYIFTGIVEFKNGYRALENKDYELANRMLRMGVLYTLIGVVILLTSTLKYFAPKLAFSALLISNPWILPIFYFLACLPNLLEISKKMSKFYHGTDVGTQLRLKEALSILEKDVWKDALLKHFEDSPLGFKDFNQEGLLSKERLLPTDQNKVKLLSQKMEDLQAEIGTLAGMEAFNLLINLLKLKEGEDIKKEVILAQVKKLEKACAEWKHAQMIRLAQQVFVTLFTVVTVTAGLGQLTGGMTPETAKKIHGWNYIAMAVERGIPFYMDRFRPYERNSTLVVERVDDGKVVADLSKMKASLAS